MKFLRFNYNAQGEYDTAPLMVYRFNQAYIRRFGESNYEYLSGQGRHVFFLK